MLECLRFFNKTMNMKRDVGSGETGSDEAPRLRYFHVSHVSHVREPESTRVEASQRTTVTFQDL